MNEKIIKAMIQNTLTENQILKLKEIYDQRIYLKERFERLHFTKEVERGVTAEDILKSIKDLEK